MNEKIDNPKLFLYIFTFYIVISIFLTIFILILNNFSFTYCLDDAYIHLSISKNLIENKVWGINDHQFSSCSSSILYTLFLSILFIILNKNSLYIITPYFLNHIFNVLILYIFFKFLNELKIKTKLLIILNLLPIFVIPLINNPFIGMEHSVQIFLSLLFFKLSIKILNFQNEFNVLNKNDNKFIIDKIYLIILASLITMIRYEGFLLLCPVCLMFLIKKDYLYSLILIISGFLPNILFGIYNVKNGAFFIPTSILIKTIIIQQSNYSTSLVNLLAFLNSFIRNLLNGFYITLGIIITLMILINEILLNLKENNTFKGNKLKFTIYIILKDKMLIGIVIYVLTSFLHLSLARLSWFYRYESYILSIQYYILIFYMTKYRFFESTKKLLKLKNSVGKNFEKFYKKNLNNLFNIFTIILLFSLIIRGLSCVIRIPFASKNIYEQQIQMSKFIKLYYNNQSIAANDVGALNYYTDALIIDLVGLSNQEIAEYRLQKSYTTEVIEYISLKYNVSIAVVFDHWFSGTFENLPKLPSSWIKVAQWKISQNVVCGGDVISWYGLNLEDAIQLKYNLIQFEIYLPDDVEVIYLF